MKRGRRRIAALAIAALLLTRCGEAPSDEHVIDEPVIVEHPKGLEVARLTLTASASKRLDIQTVPVKEKATGAETVVPSAAVLVDPEGVWWVYTSPEPLVFIRHRIDIDNEEGNRAFLSEGPRAGTEVVTVGVAELYGAEFEIGH